VAHDCTYARAVLEAAQALLDARENQMVTSEEWDALQHAVADATQSLDGPNETFSITENVLVRSVVPKRGKPYDHTCDLDIYEAVAHTIDELEGATFTYEEIRQKVDGPFTQVAVAIAFLRERGLIEPAQRRRSVAASKDDVYLGAMIEWHALREGAPGCGSTAPAPAPGTTSA
jgi:hypothetical protein